MAFVVIDEIDKTIMELRGDKGISLYSKGWLPASELLEEMAQQFKHVSLRYVGEEKVASISSAQVANIAPGWYCYTEEGAVGSYGETGPLAIAREWLITVGKKTDLKFPSGVVVEDRPTEEL